MTPEQMLPDDVDGTVRNGVAVRKGSVGAFLANARILNDATSSAVARDQARTDLLALVPAMTALGLFEVFSLRDPALAALVEPAMRTG